MKTVLLTAAAVFAGFAFTTGAGAYEPAHSGSQVSVRYGDLDLSKPAGAEAMLDRLDRAAKHVCGRRPDTRNLFAKRGYNRCLEAALADAVEQLDAPLVSALHSDQPRFARRESD